MINKKNNSSTSETPLFLPNFCSVQLVFLGVILAELLAFVLALSPLSNENHHWIYLRTTFWEDLALISMFVQWVTLLSMSILCLFRKPLSYLEDEVVVGVLSYLCILLITWLVSRVAWELKGWIEEYYFAVHWQPYLALLKNLFFSLLLTTLLIAYGFFRYHWKRGTIILVYALVILGTILLTELMTLLLSSHSQWDDAAHFQLFLIRNLGISAIVSTILLRYFYIQYRWRKQTEATAYSRVQALQARIRPHFLFNSMNSIATLIHIDPDKAEEAVEDLSELFRASLSDARAKILIAEELDLCEQYLRIESLRLDERLQVEWNIDTLPHDALVPRLCLQPLLENAIYYGIQPLPEGGLIEITGFFDGKYIRLDIENPLSLEPMAYKSKGHGIAQQNIRERLYAHYGEAGSFTIQRREQSYCVSLRFPYQTDYEDSNS